MSAESSQHVCGLSTSAPQIDANRPAATTV